MEAKSINLQFNKINYLDYSNIKLERFAEKIKFELDTTGYLLVKNYRLETKDLEELKLHYHQLHELIGLPISHDRHNTIIWDIKSNPNAIGKNGVITYSEHNHEADLHTDSQYSEYPEDYFSLLTLEKAQCGGGISYLLSLPDILEELNQSEEGKTTLNIIQSTNYPFIVPSVFKKGTQAAPEFNFGPILRDNEIRFRVDTIQKAINYNAEFCTSEQVTAFDFLVKLMRTTHKMKKFFLEKRDLIFVNNKTMLHGRGSFTDANRHLLRIRMNKYTA